MHFQVLQDINIIIDLYHSQNETVCSINNIIMRLLSEYTNQGIETSHYEIKIPYIL